MEISVKLFSVEKDGLPDMKDLVGQVAFLMDGNIVSGWPLDEKDENGNPYWEADSDVGRKGKFAGVKQYMVFDRPIWEFWEYKSKYVSVMKGGSVWEGVHTGPEWIHQIDLIENLQALKTSPPSFLITVEKEGLVWEDLMIETKGGCLLFDTEDGYIWRDKYKPKSFTGILEEITEGNISFCIDLRNWTYYCKNELIWKPIIKK